MISKLFLLLLWLLLLTVSTNQSINLKKFNDNLCMVSGLIRSTKQSVASDVHPYPEFYSKFYNISSTFPKAYLQQPCNSSGDYMLSERMEHKFKDKFLENWVKKLWKRHGNRTAVSQCIFNICPLVSENLASTWKVIQWNFSADALCAIGKLRIDESQSDLKVRVIVFGGSMTLGEEAVGGCCSSQSKTSICDKTFDHMNSHLSHDRWYCYWFGYLSRWFNHKFPNVKFEFHNLALGGHTSRAMFEEVTTLMASRNIKFSKKDIILLDHSCNDGGDGEGLELLIREIYRLCQHFDPTIIIIEQLPKPDSVYFDKYRETAAYYQVPYFSHREIILNPTTDQKYLFSGISTMPMHVPWHVHMLIADALTSWMSELIEYKCTKIKQSAVPKYINSTLHIIHKPLYKVNGHLTNGYENTKRLYASSDRFGHFRCNKTMNMLIDNTPNSTYVPSNLTKFEETNITGWTIFKDYKRKPPAWIINKYSNKENRFLDVSFPALNLSSDSGNYFTRIGLRIKYLKTYMDAGHVNVFLCGHKLNDIDALTPVHTSVPNSYYYKLTKSESEKCNTLTDFDRRLSIEYTGTSYPHNRNPRKNFKVKILAIKLCYVENDEISN